MKKFLRKYGLTLSIALIAIGAFGIAGVHMAHAQTAPQTQSNAAGGSVPATLDSVTKLFGLNIGDFVTEMTAWIVNMGISLASWLIAIAGFFLNFSINLTLNIKSFVDNTQAIYTTWRAIRDISSLFIIFFLLWAGLQMILGLNDHSFRKLITNIIVAGALINFSFFFAGLCIDISNIVSVQLYNAIAPANSLNVASATLGPNTVTSHFNDGGLSNVFMQSLQISSIYKNKLANTDGVATLGAPLKIILGGSLAISIEIAGAISFMAAAFAFMMRFVILLVLLAFSPIWFVTFIFPDLKAYSSKWMKTFTDMLLFMPVYLLLMYLALNVLTTSTVLRNGFNGNLIAGAGGDAWYSNLLILGVNSFIVIFLLDMPLIAAISFGGVATGWIQKSGISKASGAAISKWMGGWVGTRTVGRAANRVNEDLEKTRIPVLKTFVGNSLIGKTVRKATVGALADSKMGYRYSNTERVKEKKEIQKRDIEINREAGLNDLLSSNTGSTEQYKKFISLMSGKEKQELAKSALKNPQVLKHFKKDDFDALKKSDSLKDEDKKDIKDARIAALKDAATKSAGGDKEEGKAVKHMLKNMETDDISGLDSSLLENPGLIEHLTSGQLKALAETDMSADTRKKIASTILGWSSRAESKGKQHVAYGWMKKNNREWDGDAKAPAEEDNETTG